MFVTSKTFILKEPPNILFLNIFRFLGQDYTQEYCSEVFCKAFIEKETLAQVFSSEILKIFKNTSERLLLEVFVRRGSVETCKKLF